MRRIRVLCCLVIPVVCVLAAASIATPATSAGCAQFKVLRRVFPTATAVGFGDREPIVRESLRQPIWPGTCGKLFTRYRLGGGAIEVSVTLYRTHKQALVALAEPQYLPVDVLGNGAQLRVGIFPASVNGTAETGIGAASVYRNVFISSLEISRRPISAQAHVRLHRGIHARVQRLRQE